MTIIKSRPFEEGKPYYAIQNGKVVERCCSRSDQEMHDRMILPFDDPYFSTKEEAEEYLTQNKQQTMMQESIVNFWNGNHLFSEELTNLEDRFVPMSGSAATPHGEAIRAVSRLNYEYFNNGNCNAAEINKEICPSCDGSGFEDGEEEDEVNCHECDGERHIVDGMNIDSYFEEMLLHIEKYVPDSMHLVSDVQQLICDPYLNYNYEYDQAESDVYNALTAHVIMWVVNDCKDKFPYTEGVTYYTIEDGKIIESCWDDISEDEYDPHRLMFASEFSAKQFLIKNQSNHE